MNQIITANTGKNSSGTAAGKCHDAGAVYPSNVQVLGRVADTHNPAIPPQVYFFGTEARGVGPNGLSTTTGLFGVRLDVGTTLSAPAGGNVGVNTATARAQLEVASGGPGKFGDIYVSGAGNGLIVKSPDGLTCKQIGIDNSGAISVTAIACP